MKVGLIGLGKLGLAVGERLVATGCGFVCWNRSRTPPGVLDGRRVESLAELVDRSDRLILLVRDDAAVLDICRQLAALPMGDKLLLQMSTVRPPTAREAAALVAAAGGRCIDVPVAGTLGPAREGKLMMLAGGAPADIEAASPLLALLGRRTVVLGPVGAGSYMKLSLNLILTLYNEALGEALALGKTGGLDINTMLDVIADSAAGLPMVTAKRTLFAGTGDAVMVDLNRVASELAAIEQTAREAGLPTPAASAAAGMIAAAAAAGFGERDIAGLSRYWIEKIAR